MIEHVERCDDDHQAKQDRNKIENLAIAVQQLGDEVGGKTHEGDRNDEPDYQNRHMFLLSATELRRR